VFTSYWSNLRNIPAGLVPVGISRYAPRWLRSADRPRSDLRLAPAAATLKAPPAEYIAAFDAQLRQLDPREVFDSLGPSAVLLCYERPGEFCHRRLVAEWFEFHLGVAIPELGFDRLDTAPQTQPGMTWYEEQPARVARLKRILGMD